MVNCTHMRQAMCIQIDVARVSVTYIVYIILRYMYILYVYICAAICISLKSRFIP